MKFSVKLANFLSIAKSSFKLVKAMWVKIVLDKVKNPLKLSTQEKQLRSRKAIEVDFGTLICTENAESKMGSSFSL